MICDGNSIPLFAELEAGIKALNGRYFGGRLVQADSYDPDMYAANDLSG